MEADMVSNPISLFGFSNCQATYSVNYQCEANQDVLSICYSVDGHIFISHRTYTGGTGSWLSVVDDLSFLTPADTIWIEINFSSDNQNSNFAGGYIDNLIVTGTQTSFTNLYNAWPPFWDNRIVVSETPNSGVEPFEYSVNRPYYISWGVGNNGVFASPPSQVDLYIDGNFKAHFSLPALLSDSIYKTFTNYSYTFTSPQVHDIRIEINPNETFEEESFSDNISVRIINIPPPPPDLAPFAPAGWGGSLVVNQTTLQQNPQDQTLVAGTPTFVHWGIKNYGLGNSGSFSVRLKVDGVVDTIISYPSLAAGSFTQSRDIPIGSLTAQNHTISLEIDYNNTIVETTDLNNNQSRVLPWIPAASTVIIHADAIQYNVVGFGFNVWEPVEGYRVEVWDAIDSTSIMDTLIWYGTTGGNGTFTTPPIPNIEENGTGQDILIVLYATIPDTVLVERDTVFFAVQPAGVQYTVYPNVSSGNLYIHLPVDTMMSKYFYVADRVRESYKKWRQIRPGNIPGQIKVAVSNLFDGSQTVKKNDTLRQMQISANLASNIGPDCFDKSILFHESGHVFHYLTNFFDEPIDPDSTTHYLFGEYNPKLSSGEGFANFWSRNMADDSLYLDEFISLQSQYRKARWINFDKGTYGRCSVMVSGGPILYHLADTSANTRGDSNEIAVAGLFLDMIDNTTDIEDFSGPQDRNILTLPHHPDGKGDSMHVPIDSTLSALIDRQVPQMMFKDKNGQDSIVTAHKPDRLSDFLYNWYHPTSLGHFKGMADLRLEHGMSCCFGFRGNVNNDTTDAVNIQDLTYLQNYLFQGGPPPSCLDEGNVNGKNNIDIQDITYRVNYLFNLNTPAPPRCPEY